MDNNEFFFYVLECSDSSLYAGYTNNLQKRLEMHNTGRGSKYVRSRLPFTLKYWEKTDSKSDALKKEALFKKLDRSKKLMYIKHNLKK